MLHKDGMDDLLDLIYLDQRAAPSLGKVLLMNGFQLTLQFSGCQHLHQVVRSREIFAKWRTENESGGMAPARVIVMAPVRGQ